MPVADAPPTSIVKTAVGVPLLSVMASQDSENPAVISEINKSLVAQ